MTNNVLSLGAYLKRISESFNKNKSMTEILDSFRCISKEYQEFNSSLDNNEFTYSSYEYTHLREDERRQFDVELMIPDQSLSISEGAIVALGWQSCTDKNSFA